MRIPTFAALVALFVGSPALARPRTGTPFKPGLSHVVVIVNGERSAVPAGQSLHVYRGDDLVFVQAESRDPALRPASLAIDVEGFANSGPGANDRGLDISTAGLEARTFPVVIRAGERTLGRIKLVVAEPRFDYAVMLVNNEPVTVRAGGKVELKPSDIIRVQSVRTNIPDPSKVEVDFASPSRAGGGSLRFKYRGRIFGEIRMPVSGARAL